MSFKVFLSKDVFKNIPNERKNQIKDALFELEDPFPGGNKAEIEGSKNYYRLRIGNFRAIYKVDFENSSQIHLNMHFATGTEGKFESGFAGNRRTRKQMNPFSA